MAAASESGAPARWFMCTDCRVPFKLEGKSGPFIGTCSFCERLVVFQEKGARELYEQQQEEKEEKQNAGYRSPSAKR